MNNFLEFLSKNCNNLTMLEISLDTCPSNKIELSQIITSLLHQRRLKYIKFSGNDIFNSMWSLPNLSIYSSFLNLLPTQNNSLQKLEFKNLSLNNISKKDLDSLCLLKYIRELKLDGIENSTNLNCWTTILTKLEVFEINHYSQGSKDFIIQLLQSSSNTLVKLIILDVPPWESYIVIPLYQQIHFIYIH